MTNGFMSMEGDSFEFSWSWRTLAALVYLAICLTDFLVMPIYYEWSNSHQPLQLIQLAMQFKDPAAQVQALQILRANRVWTPITNEMFHLSFGAILGLSALPTNRSGSGFRMRRKNDHTVEIEVEASND